MNSNSESLSRWLSSRFFLPLLISSILAMGLFAAWPAISGAWTGPRLQLNLSLAWLPYLFALWAIATHQRHPRSRARLVIPGVLWLAFFPNAPYLITDWLYLPGLTAELWYSIALFTAFSFCGVLLSVVSLYLMQELIDVTFGRFEGWLLAGLAIFLSGLGVYLGRILRLNSWDLFLRPRAVFDDLFERARTIEQATPLGFTAGFALLIGVFYYVFRAIRLAPRSREERII